MGEGLDPQAHEKVLHGAEQPVVGDFAQEDAAAHQLDRDRGQQHHTAHTHPVGQDPQVQDPMDRLGDEEIAAGHGQSHQYGEAQAGLQFWRGCFRASQDT